MCLLFISATHADVVTAVAWAATEEEAEFLGITLLAVRRPRPRRSLGHIGHVHSLPILIASALGAAAGP
jgi:alkylation response protein AidB-like acyl-CoA dehydrogenase